MKLTRLIGFGTSAVIALNSVGSVFAQATSSASKGGTSSSLPNAGTTEITYALFVVGLVLFVVGTLKLVSTFRE